MFDLSHIRPAYPDPLTEVVPRNPLPVEPPAKTANPSAKSGEISRLAVLAAPPTGENTCEISRLANLAGVSASKKDEMEISNLAGLAGVPETKAGKTLDDLGYTIRYITETESASRAVSELLDADHAILGLDIETGGLDPLVHTVRCIQIANESIAYVFDLATIEPAVLMDLLKNSRQFIAHNGLFEYRFLKQLAIEPVILHDSMLMARVVFGLQAGGDYMSLADTASRVLGIHVDKSVRLSNWTAAGPLSKEQVQYAALDAVLTYQLAFPLRDELRKTGQNKAYSLLIRVLPTVGSQMLAGLGFDRTGHQQLIEEWKTEAVAMRARLDSIMPGINPDSPVQLAGWLANQLPPALLRNWPKTAKGNLSTDASTLSSCADIPVELRQYKKAGKLLSTYGEKYADHIHPATGRIHADFSIAGTVGGRFKCARPNLQNPPRMAAFRRLFRPADEQRRMVVADYSQIELRIAALLSGDEAMLQAYRVGVDLHRLTASITAGVPLDEVTKEQRQAAKAINFGLIYGMQPPGLRSYARATYGVEMSKEEAEKAHTAFFQHYQGLRRWHQTTKARGTYDATVRTVSGLVRNMGRETGGWKLTNALNTPVQGSGAEVLLLALAKLPAALVGLDCRVVHHVHDEIILECGNADVDAAKLVLQEAMTAAFDELFPGNGISADLVEAHAGETWKDAKG